MLNGSFRLIGYEEVYLKFHKLADTPFHIQWDELSKNTILSVTTMNSETHVDLI